MARIPDEALERLKREVSLARLIEAQGLKLISQGKDLACRCPWHEGDDTPSCIVSPKTNLWHCFGCDAGGSVIDWVMRRRKVRQPILTRVGPAAVARVRISFLGGRVLLRKARSVSLARLIF